MPIVSIILPNFNHEKFLHSRIETILNQSFTDYEIIILDDASTDQSVAKINEFNTEKQFVHIVTNETNSGSTFIQWKKGFDLAKGEYIWIAESDDESDKEFLQKSINKLTSNVHIGVVYCPSIWIDNKGKEIHRPLHEEGGNSWNGKELIPNAFLTGNLIYNASSAVFRKDLLKNVNFNEITKYKYAGDWLFWVQILANTSVERLADRMNFFRRHEHNISFKSDKKGLQFTEGIKISQYIFNNFEVSFLKKRVTMLKWAKKLSLAPLENSLKVVNQMPSEIKFWFRLLKIFK